MRRRARLRPIVDGLALRIAHLFVIIVFSLRRLAQIKTHRDARDKGKQRADQARERRGKSGVAEAEYPADNEFAEHHDKARGHRGKYAPFGASSPPDGKQQRGEEGRGGEGEGGERGLQRIDLGDQEEDGGGKR